jgi:hypothetical protein
VSNLPRGFQSSLRPKTERKHHRGSTSGHGTGSFQSIAPSGNGAATGRGLIYALPLDVSNPRSVPRRSADPIEAVIHRDGSGGSSNPRVRPIAASAHVKDSYARPSSQCGQFQSLAPLPKEERNRGSTITQSRSPLFQSFVSIRRMEHKHECMCSRISIDNRFFKCSLRPKTERNSLSGKSICTGIRFHSDAPSQKTEPQRDLEY